MDRIRLLPEPPRRPELPSVSGFRQLDIEKSQARFRALLKDLESEFESMMLFASKLNSQSYNDASERLPCSTPKSAVSECTSTVIGPRVPSIAPIEKELQLTASRLDSLNSIDSDGTEVDKLDEPGCEESMVLERWRAIMQKVLNGHDTCVLREEWAADQSMGVSTLSPVRGVSSRPRFTLSDSSVDVNFRKIENEAVRRARIMSAGKYPRNLRSSRTRNVYKFRRGCVSHPDSAGRRLWLLFTFLMIGYEFFAITMSPFRLFTSGFVRSMEWITGFFWLLDIFFNFTTGVYIMGKVEMAFSVVANRYIRGWLLFDFLLVAMQFAALWVDDEHLGASGVLKLVRVTRSVRLKEKFLRLQQDLGLSSIGNTILFLRIFYCFTGLFLFVHCSACLFYEVGSQTGTGWVSENTHRLSDSGLHNYFVALHWSLSQMQGSIDIYPGPNSTTDRLFCVASSCLSIVVQALVVSVMTDTLISIRQQRKQRAHEEFYVSVFFSRHDIRPDIRARAEHHLLLRERRQEAFTDNELNQVVLQMFPAEFSTLLLAEIQGYQLTWHPLFEYLDKFHRPLFIKACSSIIILRSYEPNDDAFTAGSYSTHAHIIAKGEFVLNVRVDINATLNPWLKQISMDEATESMALKRKSSQDCLRSWGIDPGGENYASTVTPFKRLERGQLVCEVALWMYRLHVGSLCSVDYGQCYNISAVDLGSIIAHHPVAHSLFSSYACRFARVAESLLEDDNGSQKIELMTFHTVIQHERAWDSKNSISATSEVSSNAD